MSKFMRTRIESQSLVTCASEIPFRWMQKLTLEIPKWLKIFDDKNLANLEHFEVIKRSFFLHKNMRILKVWDLGVKFTHRIAKSFQCPRYYDATRVRQWSGSQRVQNWQNNFYSGFHFNIDSSDFITLAFLCPLNCYGLL